MERTWITDERKNRCSVEFWGSEEAAKKALATLVDCEFCSDCSDCSRCSGCDEWREYNRGEVVLTPFLGVGSEVYGAVINGRRAIGIELKESYYRQACKNLENAAAIEDTSAVTNQSLLEFAGFPHPAETV